MNTRNEILLGICFLGLVFSLHLFVLGVILLALFIIKEKLSNNQSFWFYCNHPATSMVTLYVIFILGLLYSSNLQAGFFTLEKSFSLLIIPVMLASLPPLKDKSIVRILALFSLLIASVCAIIFTLAFVDYSSSIQSLTTDTTFKFFKNYRRGLLTDTDFISFHHSYLGLMIATAILVIITYYKQFPLKPAFLFVGLFLFLFLIQLEAKMSLIALILTLLTACFVHFLENKSRKVIILFFLSCTLAFGGLISIKSNFLFTAVDKVINADGGSRVRNWQSAIEAISDAPLFGHGTGDSETALQAYRHKDSWEHQQKYNAHNQYLDITLRFGLVGLFYWLFLLGYLLWKSYSLNQYFFFFFILLFALSSFTEVLLDRFHGVALFALILSIFANITGKHQKDDYPKTIKKAQTV